MLEKLPANLPTDWENDRIIAPNGEEIGEAPEYGYNYLMEQVNLTQTTSNALIDIAAGHDESIEALETKTQAAQTSAGSAQSTANEAIAEIAALPAWAKAPAKPTYTAAEVGAVPTTRTINGKELSGNISLTAADVGALDASWEPTPAEVGAVPITRTVNGKSLSSDITLNAADVSARPANWTPSATDVGAIPAGTVIPVTQGGTGATSASAGLTALGGVPSTRKVAGKALSGDISLTASDVGALPSSTSLATLGGVPTSRTVNGKALSSDITLAAADVGAVPSTGGTISGNVRLKNSSNYGCKLNFGDGDYVYLSEPSDDILEIHAKQINFTGGGGISGGTADLTAGTSNLATNAIYCVYE